MIQRGAPIAGLKGQRLRVTQKGNLQTTLEWIKRATGDSVPQVAKLAQSLKGKNLAQSARNIYEFVVAHVAYKLDRNGSEEIRNAARTWADRGTGVDCEDYSILIAALALNMGYRPVFEIVNLNNDPGMDHIFTVIYAEGPADMPRGKGYVADPTPHPLTQRPVPFNERPKGIKETMEVEYLQGLSGQRITDDFIGYDDEIIMGLAGNFPARKATLSLVRHQKRLIQQASKGQAPGRIVAPEIRKTRYAISLNGSPEQETIMDLWPAIADINRKGELVWKPGVNLKDVSDYIRIKEAADRSGRRGVTLGELRGLGYLSHDELSGFFGDLAKKAKAVTKKIASKVKSTVKNTARKVGNTVKKVAPKVANAVNKINPAAVAGRLAFLAAMRANTGGLAANLRWGYLSESQARAKNFDLSEWQKVKQAKERTERLFFGFGGSKESLEKAIQDGSKKSGLSGLGAVPAAILALLQPIINFIKEKVNFGKLLAKVKGSKAVQALSRVAQGFTRTQAKVSADVGLSAAEQQQARNLVTQSPERKGITIETKGGDNDGGDMNEEMKLKPIVLVAGLGVLAAILFFVL